MGSYGLAITVSLQVSLPSLALKRRLCISHVPGNDDYAEHLKDGECWRYLSQDEYLLFCCCYESDHWCRYSADHSKDSIWKYNARYWPTNSELRAVYDVPFYDRTATAKEWNYRDFVYSRPLKRKKRNFVTDENIRVWHCVTGNLSLKSASGSYHTKDVERVMRKDLPLRGRSCFVDVSVAFRKIGSSIIPESVDLEYGHSNEPCGAMTCRMVEPNCIDDLLDRDRNYSKTRIRCCCGTNNLCNHREGSNLHLAKVLPSIDFSKVCLGGVYAFFANAFTETAAGKYILCSHYLDFETGSERLMVYGETFYVPVLKGEDYASHYFNNSQELNFRAVVVFPLPRPQCERTYSRHIMQFGVVFCSSGFGALRQGYSCDKGYLDQMRRFANKFERPLCYEGWYKLDVRNSSGEMTKKVRLERQLFYIAYATQFHDYNCFEKRVCFHYFNNSQELNFRAVVVFPLPRPQCERTYSRHIMQFGVVFCSSGFGALRQGYSCDKGYLDQMRRFANKFERPLCYEGWYKLDVRNSSGEMTKKLLDLVSGIKWLPKRQEEPVQTTGELIPSDLDQKAKPVR
ncbi:hypothetical protein Tcan_05460 [Toxocara canis]|uniref:Uncharacterized protein n=1 Tax=Toxocara canis TaxID=6265 RepID=A0A0B2VAW3_TOXCA|nr:hypothetical protein Tcan_05460 [Toxocara canis]